MSQGQIDAIENHANDTIRDLYLPKLISGEWSGTMNLTEPQAGSDVGALTSKAINNGDGSYSITGQKIERLNNNLDQFFLAVDRQFIVRDDFIVNMFTLKTENTRGVAGSTTFPSYSATRTDDYELFALSFNKFFDKGLVNVSMNRSNNNQVYDDSNGSFPTFSEHDLEYSSFMVKGK